MKFGKRLQRHLEETLPEWRDKFLSYKELKKRLKLISDADPLGSASHEQEAGRGKEIDEEGGDGVEERGNVGDGAPDGGHSALASSSASSSLLSGPPSVAAADGSVAAASSSCSVVGSPSVDLSSNPLLLCAGMKQLSPQEADFIHYLNAELEKFNHFFMEKEEDYVIRLQELKERIESLKTKLSSNGISQSETGLNEEMINIRKEIVTFHGEMVLLENYSSLNYTGLVKIVKKHDKRTGALLRMPFMQNVLHQPFFTTELLSKLVVECEMNLQSLFPSCEPPSGMRCQKRDKGKKPLLQIGKGEGQSYCGGEELESICRSTAAALQTIKDLRQGSSTYNAFSLPPFEPDEDGVDDSGDVKGIFYFYRISPDVYF